MSDFRDRVAVVTGGSSGIGRQTALDFAEAGARVFVIDVDEKAAEDLRKSSSGSSGDIRVIAADVAQSESIENAMMQAFDVFGKVDILVHSAGVGLERSFLETTKDEWRRVIDVDLTGTFFACQAAARCMAPAGYGRIVVLASVAGLRGGQLRAAYGAAKGGVISLVKVMSTELARYGITANAIAPGAIETAMVRKMHTEKTRAVYHAAIPQHRYGSPGDVSSAALYLASERSAYISGHILAVDGGFMAAGLIFD